MSKGDRKKSLSVGPMCVGPSWSFSAVCVGPSWSSSAIMCAFSPLAPRVPPPLQMLVWLDTKMSSLFHLGDANHVDPVDDVFALVLQTLSFLQ